eukprot:gene11584-4828_t
MRKTCLSTFKNILNKVEPDTIIAKDLPRLRINIENSQSYQDIKNKSAEVMYNLSKFLRTKIELEPKEYHELYKEHKTDHKDLFNFLVQYYGTESKELLILRCLTQKALAQPMIYFKKILSTVNIPFRDKKWSVEIKRENEFITVTHLRTEKVESEIPEENGSFQFKPLYTFSWKVIIFIKETEDQLFLDSSRFEFVSIDDYDHEISTDCDLKEESLNKIFISAFSTIKNYDLKKKQK